MSEQTWKEILENARWAPSAYNAQPWLFRIDHEQLTLLSRPKRWRPVVDPTNRETLISLGAMVHSLRLSASASGHDLDEEFLLDSPFSDEIARFTLRPETSTQAADSELAALRSVRTWRREYRHELIPVQELELLVASDESRIGFSPKGSPEARRLIDLSVESAIAHANTKNIYAELASFLDHPSRGNPSFGLSSPVRERTGMSAFAWDRLSGPKRAVRKAYRASTISDARDLLHQAPALATLRGISTNSRDLIEVGTAYQKLRLAAFRLGLATHPVSLLPQMAARGVIELPEELLELQLIVRVGVPMEEKRLPVSRRESVEALVVGERIVKAA